MENKNESLNLLKEAYKCKKADLDSLLKKIELAIKNSSKVDDTLLEAKLVVTSKLAVNNVNKSLQKEKENIYLE